MIYRQSKNNTSGISEVIGFTLLLSLAIVTSVVLVGLATDGPLQTLEQNSEARQLENTFSQISSDSVRAAVSGVDSSGTVQLPFASGGDKLNASASGSVEVWSEQPDGTTTTILDKQIGYLNYQKDDYNIVFQNGGVWKIYDNGSVDSVTTPEFYYSGQTLTLPLIKVDPTKTEYTDTIKLDHVQDGRSTSQLAIDDEIVYVKVQGPAYRGWGSYFEERLISSAVSYNHGNNSVTVELGLGGNLFDKLENATISAGDVSFPNGNPTINGDVLTAGSVDKSNVNGTVTKKNELNYVTLDSYIRTRVDSIQQNHTTLSSLDGKVLDDGKSYYISSASLKGETATIDLSDGDVSLAIDGDIEIINNGQLQVENPEDGTLRLYLMGDMYISKGNSEWVVEDEDAGSSVVFGRSTSKFRFSNGASFDGVIYAPSGSSDQQNSTNTTDDPSNPSKGNGKGGGNSGGGNSNANACKSTAQACLGVQTDFKGALVAGSVELGQKAELNYDTDLEDYNLDFEEYQSSRPKLSYIHTSIAEVDISEAE